MTRFIDNGIEVPGIPKLYKWPDGGWRPEPPLEEGVLTESDLGNHVDFEAVQPELHPGDRVRHDTLGEGIIAGLHSPQGLAYVWWDSRSGDEPPLPVALSLLTKVEPEEEQCPSDCLLRTPGALREQLASRLMDARWDGRYQDYALQGADVALAFFREHFDSKRGQIGLLYHVAREADRSDWTGYVDTLRAILFGEDT